MTGELKAVEVFVAVLGASSYTFFTLEALNARIRELCDQLNARPRKQLGGVSRRDLFERIERASLISPPSTPFVARAWKVVRPNSDYHVEIDQHWYSVPHELAHEEMEACFTATTVEILYLGKRIASHAQVPDL